MGNEVLIKVEGVSKKFCKDLRTSLAYGVKDLAAEIFGSQRHHELRKHEFWAVNNVSFELRRGECLGLIGANGSGKSTMLKMINGLIKPDRGRIEVWGRVGALIELGAGFNPILTGRENIYNNAAVLGLSKSETDNRYAEIVAFSELDEFIDMPVQSYSSGMKVRLGFAVAIHIDPDVLLIDEVLAVGDVGFRLKCLNAMDKMMSSKALIFVSHSMPMISRMCSHLALLKKGTLIYSGNNVNYAISQYYSELESQYQIVYNTSNEFEIMEASLVTESMINDMPIIKWGNDLIFHFKIKIPANQIKFEFSVIIYDIEQRAIAILSHFFENADLRNEHSEGGNIWQVKIKHKNVQISKGIYQIRVMLSEGVRKNILYRVENVLRFQVDAFHQVHQPFMLDAEWGLLKYGSG